MSPWNHHTHHHLHPLLLSSPNTPPYRPNHARLLGSLVREEGHIYSLAMDHDLLYTGSDSKNIRVWRNLQEFSCFKSTSGLVKAIVLSGNKIFTGHQDGRIRVWKVSPRNPGSYRRSGTLPTLKDIFKSSVKPSNYVEVRRRRRSALWIKHSDAISCMSLEEKAGLLYTSSWDRTFKVWRISDSKCMESVQAHQDAVNSIVSTPLNNLLFTGSADGTVKAWRRESHGRSIKHLLLYQLLSQDCAVTALAFDPLSSLLYSGSSNGIINFWENRNRENEKKETKKEKGEAEEEVVSHGGVMRGHKLAVLCLSTGGGVVMLSGSADKRICVWRRRGLVHTCVCVLTGHTGPVKCLAVKEEEEEEEVEVGLGRRWTVYSGSLDKSVKVWSVSMEEEEEEEGTMMVVRKKRMVVEEGEPLWDSFHSGGSSDCVL